MKSAELPIAAQYYKVAIPFSAKEQASFRSFLKRTDKKAGAFARTAILAAMAKEGCV
jgi:hypothetical protein